MFQFNRSRGRFAKLSGFLWDVGLATVLLFAILGAGWMVTAAVTATGWTGLNDVHIGPSISDSSSLGLMVFNTVNTDTVPTESSTHAGWEMQSGAYGYWGSGAVEYRASGSNEVWVSTAVSLTSPTVTFDATNKRFISLTSDANLTGIHPVNGTTGQVISIVSGAGSNTMRFDDDATSMTIGGNVTLTEAQNDVLALVCIAAPTAGETNGYGKWAALYAHDN